MSAVYLDKQSVQGHSVNIILLERLDQESGARASDWLLSFQPIRSQPAKHRITADGQHICTKSDVTQLLCFHSIFNEKRHFFAVKSPTITATPRVRH